MSRKNVGGASQQTLEVENNILTFDFKSYFNCRCAVDSIFVSCATPALTHTRSDVSAGSSAWVRGRRLVPSDTFLTDTVGPFPLQSTMGNKTAELLQFHVSSV